MPNLLQKASIVLTPTAYNDGEVLCAKPDDGSGDFDFSRNSAATRVNAQGLVENVQILSSNLVQNPSFSEEGVQEISNGSFSQESAELVTNGSFDTDSNWNGVNTNGVTISNGSLNFSETPNGTNITQSNVVEIGKSYKVTFTISNYVKGGILVVFGAGGVTQEISANGTFTLYGVASLNTVLYIQARGASGTTLSIENCSVREVAQDWNLGTGWSIGEDKAICDGTQGYIVQTDISGAGVTATYKVQWAQNITTGTRLRFFARNYNDGGNATTLSITRDDGTSMGGGNCVGSGTFTAYVSSTNGYSFKILAETGVIGSITNISVKEVGMDWDLGTGFSIDQANSKATCDGSQTSTSTLQTAQGISNIQNDLVKLSFEIKDYSAGAISSVTLQGTGGIEFSNLAANGVYEINVTSSDASPRLLFNANSSFVGSITNVSVIEITDNTNLPRINYEGFSYQDVLGSEEISNGSFDTDTKWTTNTGWSISDGSANCDGTQSSNATLVQQNGIKGAIIDFVVGKTYRVNFDIVVTSGWVANVEVASGYDSNKIATSGNHTAYITAVSTNDRFTITANPDFIGSIDNVSVKEYLGQEVVPNSGCGSWLFEPQTTQLLTYSEDFSQYSNVGTVTLTSGLSSPDGGNNAYKVEGVIGSTVLYFPSTLNANSTRSIYARTVSGTGTAQLLSHSSNTNNLFNITEDWQRFDVNLSNGAGSNNFYAIDFRGSGTLSEIILWGANATDDQDYPTSYIPTSGSQVTRNQDLCTNGATGTGLINSTEGVLYAEIASLSNIVSSNYISLSDGTYSNRISILYTSGTNIIRAFLRLGGAVQADMTFTVSDITEFHKVAFKFKENDFALWIDGVEVRTDTSGSTMPSGTLSKLSFSEINTAGGLFNGKTKAVAVWKEALSDQELADLTYPTPTDPTFTLDFDTIAEQFTFARGSEATYVDAQGLIQSTNEIGEELVVNGDFDDGSTGWLNSNINGFSISNGKLNLLDVAYAKSNFQPNVTTVGKTYKVTFEVSNYVKGQVRLFLGGSVTPAQSSNGVFTFYVTASANTAIGVQTFDGGGTTLSIDNVSVKEYTTATNTPRLDYSTGAEAFLLEPQSTNLVTQSELFTDSSWAKTRTVIQASSITLPNGLTNGYKLFANTTGGTNHWLEKFPFPTATTGQDYTLSLFVKSAGSDFIQIASSSGFPSRYQNFNISTGTKASGDISDSSITDFGNGWYRISVTETTTATTARYLIVPILSDGGRNPQFAGNADEDGVYIWGAQIEQQSYATSYIPSNGSQTTRNQETCTNATPEINSEQGVLYAEISALANDGTTRVIQLSDGSNSNRVFIGYWAASNEVRMLVQVGGVTQAFNGNTSYDILNFNKIAISYAKNNFALWINGTKVITDTSGITFPIGTLTQLDFDSNGSATFYGNTKDLQVYTKALSDAELIKLTT